MSVYTVLCAALLCAPVLAQTESNVVYGSPGGRNLKLDLYLPEKGNGPFPAVVYVHGGGWSGGSKIAFQRQATHMAKLGFVGVCIEYRLSGEAQYPAALNDAKAAVRWLRANAAKYKIDVTRIGAAGGSAGGHLVGMLGTTGDKKEFEGDSGNPGFSTKVKAVAAFNPVTDLVAVGESGHGTANSLVKFLGGSYEQKRAVWTSASPMTHVAKDSAEFLFLHGDADTTVPYKQSVDMRDKLKAAGVYADLFTAPGAAHGFFNRDPWFEPTLKAMEKFFLEHLAK